MTEPSGYTALDLIGFTDKGEYDAATNYVRNDLAHVGNDVWRCLADDTTGVTPAEGAYWTIFIENDSTASGVSYTNTTSGLAATNVQNAIDELASEKADSATTLAGYGISDAYTSTQTDNAISTAINALDVSDSAVSGSYVTAVSETDGAISVTREAADATPTASSSKMVTSGGVKTALDDKLSYADNSILGAHNLLPVDVETQTKNALTFKVNDDNSITVTGTASANTSLTIASSYTLKAGSYILSGLETLVTTISLYLSGVTAEVNYTKTEASFTLASDTTIRALIFVGNGTDLSGGVTFYPMIRLATDSDSTYQPYAMTNRELTEKVATLTSSSGTITSVSNSYATLNTSYSHYEKIAGLGILNLVFTISTKPTSWVTIGTIPETLSNAYRNNFISDNGYGCLVQITENGNIQIYNGTADSYKGEIVFVVPN